ncbi:MAG: L,D-transpeptidase [Polyangiaceae bacterium]|nr:L,D-transpeptidase [Polyangiaceae bacterium]
MRRASLLSALAAGALACGRGEPPGASAGDRSSASASASASPDPAPFAPPAASEAEEAGVATLPFGPAYVVDDEEGGVPVAALALPTLIYDLPDFTKRKLGYARPGAVLRRAEQPVAVTPRCTGGFYRVHPRGFVCQNAELTTSLDAKLAVAARRQPRRGEGLPYLYGRSRARPPHYYVRVPTPKMQRDVEGDLAEHVAKISVPNMLAHAGPPDPLPEFLTPGAPVPKPVNHWYKSRTSATRGAASARSSFAFLSVHDVSGRLFGLTTEMDLIPLDRVRLVAETQIHGGEIDDLPVALPRQSVVRYARDPRGGLVPDGTFDAWTPIPLKDPTDGELLEARDGHALSASSRVVVIKRRAGFPGFARDGDKWIDVSIAEQTLVAYEGRRAVYATIVSTGAGGDGDPETTSATIQGYYRVQAKHVTTTMLGNRADSTEYELLDVPYVQYFHGGYALHAAVWHEGFGRPRSHGCVNLPPRDAAWVFEWTEPKVPAAWHGIEANGQGTLVYVHAR